MRYMKCVDCDHKYCEFCNAGDKYQKKAKANVVTNFDRIKAMSVEKMAEYFALDKHPSTPCYICGYDDGLFCTKEDCNSEYKIKVFKEFLESEVQEDE